MNKSWILAIWVGWNLGVTVAQLDALPQCALTCALKSLGNTGCAQTDVACVCNASSFIDSLVPCTRNACSASEFDQTVAAAQGLCSSAGVDLILPSGVTTAIGPTGIATLILSDPTLLSSTSVFTSNIPAVDVPTVPSGISGFSSRDTSQTSSPRTQTTSTKSSTSTRISTTSSTSFGTSTTSTRSSSTSSPSASTSPQPANGSKLGSGAIAGIAVGVGVPLLAICLFVGFRMGRQKPDVPVIPINNDPEAREWGGIGPDKHQ